MKRFSAILLATASLTAIPQLPAAAQTTVTDVMSQSNCANHLRTVPGERAGWKIIVVVGEDVRVFQKYNGNETYPNKLSRFDIVRGYEVKDSRVLVKISGGGQGGEDFTGWVEADDLVCRDKPMVVRRNLERKVYIKPDDELIRRREENIRNAVLSVYASPSPNVKCRRDVVTPGCTKIVAMDKYFIYAEKKGNDGKIYYLISPRAALDPSTRTIIGWVVKDNAVEYSTYFGLNPDTTIGDGAEYQNKSPPFVCAFPTQSDAIAAENHRATAVAQGTAVPYPSKCIELAADSRWESSIDPLPILDRLSPDRIEAPLRVASLVDKRSNNVDIPIVENVDVVFAIDATNSMESSIQEISKNFVPQLTDKLKEKNPRVSFRFGWVVYRDKDIENPASSPMYHTLDGKSGTEPFTESVSTQNPVGIDNCASADQKAAQDSLRTVRTSTESQNPPGGIRDGYPEDLESGINAGLDMLARGKCSGNAKILVVVGDAGARLVDRAGMADRIGDRLQRMRATDKLRLSLFFAQTPRQQQSTSEKQRFYNEAYEYFDQDYKAIVGKAVNNMVSATQRSADAAQISGVISVSSIEDLSKNISDDIANLSGDKAGPDAIRRGLAAGLSLQQAYDEAQKQFPNVPARIFMDNFQADCRTMVDANEELAEERKRLNDERSVNEFYRRECSKASMISVRDMFVNYHSPVFAPRFSAPDKYQPVVVNQDHEMKISVRMEFKEATDWMREIEAILATMGADSNAVDKQQLMNARARLVEKIVGGEPKWDATKETALEFSLREGDFPISYRSILLSYKDELIDKNLNGDLLYRPGNLKNEILKIMPQEVQRLMELLTVCSQSLGYALRGQRVSLHLEPRKGKSEVIINERLRDKRLVASADHGQSMPTGRRYCLSNKSTIVGRKDEQTNSVFCWVPVEALP
jgi:hypothetical protein